MADHQALADISAASINEAASSVFPELLPHVHAFVAQREAAGGLGDKTYPVKLLELAYWLQEMQPRTCLEIGSGATSLLLRQCQRYACLEERQWGGTADRIVKDRRVNYRQTVAAATALLVEGGELDLLYVDGPNTDDGQSPPMICTDARDLVEYGLYPKNILVDLRCGSVKDMWPTLKAAGYKARASCWTAGCLGIPWFLAPMRQHTWFYFTEERSERPTRERRARASGHR